MQHKKKVDKLPVMTVTRGVKKKKNTECNTPSLDRSLSNPKPTLKLSSKSFKKIFLNTIVTFNSLQKIIFLIKNPKIPYILNFSNF